MTNLDCISNTKNNAINIKKKLAKTKAKNKLRSLTRCKKEYH